jgi:malate/lactate dehydrogenase
MCAELADTITVCDTKPGLAEAFAEDLKHAAASLRLDVEINACDKDFFRNSFLNLINLKSPDFAQGNLRSKE